MKINKIYENILQPLRISSNKTVNKPVLRTLSKRYSGHSDATAHGHDKNIFADSDTGGIDAATLEISVHNYRYEAPKKKKINASIVSSFAIEKAKKHGFLTANERIHTNKRDMPYGFCVQNDKKNAENLLLSLKKKYNNL
jgi:hypothetical protein